MNDERACAKYFCLPRNAFTNNPDADDLVNAQEFKDMAGSNAKVLLFPSLLDENFFHSLLSLLFLA